MRSPLPVARVLPSGENATERTAALWPSRLATSFASATSQSLTTLSYPPEASVLPSGENATAKTQFLCPLSAATSRPVATSQSLTSLS